MNLIDNKDVDNISEYNLPQYILNYSKYTKNTNTYKYSIIHACINTLSGRGEIKNFQILIESGYSSTILIKRLTMELISQNNL